MSDYAGYAAAITVHTNVFNDQFLSAWNTGLINHRARGGFGQLPAANGGINLFYQSPQVICSASNEIQAIVRLTGWGTLSVRLTTPGVLESRNVQFQADVLITPTASTSDILPLPDGKVKIGAFVILSAAAKDYLLTAWQFDVLSGTAFSSAAQAFFNGDVFKADLLALLQSTIGDIAVPVMDLSSLGPFSTTSLTTVDLRIAPTGVLLGVNMDNGAFFTTGDATQLKDIIGTTNDIGVVVNPDAVLPLMPQVRKQVQQQIPTGSTLNSLTLNCEEGQFRIKGSASNSDGSASFSLAAVPALTTGIPGGIFPVTEKKTITIRGRSWPALSFSPSDISVDVHANESFWDVVGNIFADALTLGFFELIKLSLISEAEGDISLGIQGSDLNPGGASPLVQRSGSPPTRLAIQDFEIHTRGLYVGITAKLEPPAARLSGINSIASNYVSQNLAYAVTLPFDALQDDPFLRIRWTVVDLDSGAVLTNSDDVALNRLAFQFIPSSVGPTTTRFAVSCRVYRALGALTTDLFNDTIRMTVGPALPHRAYIRWSYQVLNPQFQFENTDNTVAKWHLTGQSRINRRSKIHRLDKPCRNAHHMSRFSPTEQFWEILPFPIANILPYRESLCDYCFFGGPGSTVASL